VRLAAQNIKDNNLRDRVEILVGDLLSPPPRLAAGSYAHIMTNPPYLEFGRSNISPNQYKAKSNQDLEATFEHWAKFALLMVKPKGSITFIHRADFLDKILSFFNNKLGNIVVYPLWPGPGKVAKRILVSGIKNSNGPMKLMPGMVLHNLDGSFTGTANDILRRGLALDMNL
jgi:tRNA1(Val) A37 N6-methylase TrmN6